MNKIFLIAFLICCFQFSHLYSQEKLKTITNEIIDKPFFDAIPNTVKIEKDTTQFVVENIIVLNRGTGLLTVSSITGSCSCSNGVIEKNDIRFLDTGKLRLEINKEGLKNDDDTIIYTVVSNAKNSPFFITVKFVDKKKSE